MDLGAGIRWSNPKQGISGELKGHTLLTHTEEDFQEQGLALSFSWEPNSSNRGPSLSMGHTMGATPSGGMDALLEPATMEGLDTAPSSSGRRFEAELAYGFPTYDDQLHLYSCCGIGLLLHQQNLQPALVPGALLSTGPSWCLGISPWRGSGRSRSPPPLL